MGVGVGIGIGAGVGVGVGSGVGVGVATIGESGTTFTAQPDRTSAANTLTTNLFIPRRCATIHHPLGFLPMPVERIPFMGFPQLSYVRRRGQRKLSYGITASKA
jgi:hypothetical protein